ncbi:MAG: hypothetical protein RLZ84_1232, partial [Actinomycetota bacterium]
MAYDADADTRLDPRVRAILKMMPSGQPPVYSSREEVLAAAQSPEALKLVESQRQLMEICDTEEVVTAKGLEMWTEKIESQPDGNI